MSRTIQTELFNDFLDEIKERKAGDEYAFEKVYFKVTDEELKGQGANGKPLLRFVSTFLFTALSTSEDKYVIFTEQMRSNPITDQTTYDAYFKAREEKEIDFIHRFKDIGQFILTKGIISPREKK